MSKTIENLKSGNYSVVDNQGVSVTIHFVECLEKEFADLEAKLAEKITEYFNSVLALVNDYGESGVLPSYKDVLEIFEGDIPNRFFDKYGFLCSDLTSRRCKINILFTFISESIINQIFYYHR